MAIARERRSGNKNGRGITTYTILRILVIAPALIVGCYALSLVGGLLLTSRRGNDALPWDSSRCAVLAMATNMGLGEYQTFVGSLRATGYSGRIVLGISHDASSEIIDYLNANGVTMRKYIKAEKCTYDGYVNNEGKVLDMNHPPSHHPWQCSAEYPDYKMTHGRFVLYKDWIVECTECTDGIMLTDARDAYFQAGEMNIFFLFVSSLSLSFFFRVRSFLLIGVVRGSGGVELFRMGRNPKETKCAEWFFFMYICAL
jgi:hypothetical protein